MCQHPTPQRTYSFLTEQFSEGMAYYILRWDKNGDNDYKVPVTDGQLEHGQTHYQIQSNFMNYYSSAGRQHLYWQHIESW